MLLVTADVKSVAAQVDVLLWTDRLQRARSSQRLILIKLTPDCVKNGYVVRMLMETNMKQASITHYGPSAAALSGSFRPESVSAGRTHCCKIAAVVVRTQVTQPAEPATAVTMTNQ